MDITVIQARLREFTKVRDWDQFHDPKNLSMALAAEVGELLEIFQWLTAAQAANISEQDHQRVREELADVFIYLLRLADVLGVDLEDAVHRKVASNEQKYPVELSKGNATKYNRRNK